MTISINNLGNLGRLGNQMFQYASLRGIAAKNKLDWIIPYPEPKNKFNDQYHLFKTFEMSGCKSKNFGINIPERILNCQSFNFINNLYNKCPDNSDLFGYFQTEKYFIEIEDEIRKDFTFQNNILEIAINFLSKINKEKIFLHVRRGDNVYQPDSFGMCSLEYFSNALKYFFKDIAVVIVSDDIEWCKNQSLFKDERFYFSDFSLEKEFWIFGDLFGEEKKSCLPYIDLCLMSLCSGGIISNSTFSWWGAWLIKNPKYPIIAPTPWFGPSNKHLNTEDLIPNRWILLNK